MSQGNAGSESSTKPRGRKRVTSSINRAILKLNIGHILRDGTGNPAKGGEIAPTTEPALEGNVADAGDDTDLHDIEVTDDSGDEHYDNDGYTAFERRQIWLQKRRASRARKEKRRLEAQGDNVSASARPTPALSRPVIAKRSRRKSTKRKSFFDVSAGSRGGRFSGGGPMDASAAPSGDTAARRDSGEIALDNIRKSLAEHTATADASLQSATNASQAKLQARLQQRIAGRKTGDGDSSPEIRSAEKPMASPSAGVPTDSLMAATPVLKRTSTSTHNSPAALSNSPLLKGRRPSEKESLKQAVAQFEKESAQSTKMLANRSSQSHARLQSRLRNRVKDLMASPETRALVAEGSVDDTSRRQRRNSPEETAVAAFLMAGTEHREDVAAKGGEVNETSAELEAAALASTAALPVGESHAATQKESDASEQSNSDTSEIASPSRPKVITAPTVLLTTMYQVRDGDSTHKRCITAAPGDELVALAADGEWWQAVHRRYIDHVATFTKEGWRYTGTAEDARFIPVTYAKMRQEMWQREVSPGGRTTPKTSPSSPNRKGKGKKGKKKFRLRTKSKGASEQDFLAALQAKAAKAEQAAVQRASVTNVTDTAEKQSTESVPPNTSQSPKEEASLGTELSTEGSAAKAANEATVLPKSETGITDNSETNSPLQVTAESPEVDTAGTSTASLEVATTTAAVDSPAAVEPHSETESLTIEDQTTPPAKSDNTSTHAGLLDLETFPGTPKTPPEPTHSEGISSEDDSDLDMGDLSLQMLEPLSVGTDANDEASADTSSPLDRNRRQSTVDQLEEVIEASPKFSNEDSTHSATDDDLDRPADASDERMHEDGKPAYRDEDSTSPEPTQTMTNPEPAGGAEADGSHMESQGNSNIELPSGQHNEHENSGRVDIDDESGNQEILSLVDAEEPPALGVEVSEAAPASEPDDISEMAKDEVESDAAGAEAAVSVTEQEVTVSAEVVRAVALVTEPESAQAMSSEMATDDHGVQKRPVASKQEAVDGAAAEDPGGIQPPTAAQQVNTTAVEEEETAAQLPSEASEQPGVSEQVAAAQENPGGERIPRDFSEMSSAEEDDVDIALASVPRTELSDSDDQLTPFVEMQAMELLQIEPDCGDPLDAGNSTSDETRSPAAEAAAHVGTSNVTVVVDSGDNRAAKETVVAPDFAGDHAGRGANQEIDTALNHRDRSGMGSLAAPSERQQTEATDKNALQSFEDVGPTGADTTFIDRENRTKNSAAIHIQTMARGRIAKKAAALRKVAAARALAAGDHWRSRLISTVEMPQELSFVDHSDVSSSIDDFDDDDVRSPRKLVPAESVDHLRHGSGKDSSDSSSAEEIEYDEYEFSAAVARLIDLAPPSSVGDGDELDDSLSKAFPKGGHDDLDASLAEAFPDANDATISQSSEGSINADPDAHLSTGAASSPANLVEVAGSSDASATIPTPHHEPTLTPNTSLEPHSVNPGPVFDNSCHGEEKLAVSTKCAPPRTNSPPSTPTLQHGTTLSVNTAALDASLSSLAALDHSDSEDGNISLEVADSAPHPSQGEALVQTPKYPPTPTQATSSNADEQRTAMEPSHNAEPDAGVAITGNEDDWVTKAARRASSADFPPPLLRTFQQQQQKQKVSQRSPSYSSVQSSVAEKSHVAANIPELLPSTSPQFQDTNTNVAVESDEPIERRGASEFGPPRPGGAETAVRGEELTRVSAGPRAFERVDYSRGPAMELNQSKPRDYGAVERPGTFHQDKHGVAADAVRLGNLPLRGAAPRKVAQEAQPSIRAQAPPTTSTVRPPGMGDYQSYDTQSRCGGQQDNSFREIDQQEKPPFEYFKTYSPHKASSSSLGAPVRSDNYVPSWPRPQPSPAIARNRRSSVEHERLKKMVLAAERFKKLIFQFKQYNSRQDIVLAESQDAAVRRRRELELMTARHNDALNGFSVTGTRRRSSQGYLHGKIVKLQSSIASLKSKVERVREEQSAEIKQSVSEHMNAIVKSKIEKAIANERRKRSDSMAQATLELRRRHLWVKEVLDVMAQLTSNCRQVASVVVDAFCARAKADRDILRSVKSSIGLISLPVHNRLARVSPFTKHLASGASDAALWTDHRAVGTFRAIVTLSGDCLRALNYSVSDGLMVVRQAHAMTPSPSAVRTARNARSSASPRAMQQLRAPPSKGYTSTLDRWRSPSQNSNGRRVARTSQNQKTGSLIAGFPSATADVVLAIQLAEDILQPSHEALRLYLTMSQNRIFGASPNLVENSPAPSPTSALRQSRVRPAGRQLRNRSPF